MSLFPDGDLLVFFWTTAVIVFGSRGQIRKNTCPVPAKYNLVELTEPELTQAQRDYLQPLDRQLEALNYRPECTFHATNYVQNLMRRYSHPTDPASCELTMVEVKSKVGSVESFRSMNVVCFTSRLSDGRRLCTRNMPRKTVMDRLPHQIMQEFPTLTDLPALKRKHDSRAAELGPILPPPHGLEAIFGETQQEHERFSSHQVAQGVLQPTADGTAYEITNRAVNRGIINFFNPFSKRFSISQAIFTALVGAFLPLVGILKIAPAVVAATHDASLSLFSPATLAIAACYALAGAIISLSGGSNSYTWIMLVTYLPAHILAGWSFGWMPYSCVAHLVAHYLGQAKQRRSLVLQT